MDVFLGEWVNLLLRWAHLAVAIGWIGTSFYFVALDYSLSREDAGKHGLFSDAWQVHGGGFYHVAKYALAPPHLPPRLHWFQWEAYLTWITGLGLMFVQYYLHAGTYLIDPDIMVMTPLQAVMISLASLFVGCVIYDVLCRLLASNTLLLAAGVFALILVASMFYTNVYSGRGAFLHAGAFIGTIMAFNVFAVIIPNQRKLVAQLVRGEAPEARYALIGKQRSLHNNYLTLPVLAIMLSPHYPFLWTHPQNWLIVALILVSGGLFRHVLNRFDAGDDWNKYGWLAPVAIFVLFCAIYLTAPVNKGTRGAPAASDAEILAISARHCTSCHARKPTHQSFPEPPKNVTLETIDDFRRFGPLVLSQAVHNKAMPVGNQTVMTDVERETLGQWIRGQR